MGSNWSEIIMEQSTKNNEKFDWAALARAPYDETHFTPEDVNVALHEQAQAINEGIEDMRNMLTACARKYASTYRLASQDDRDPRTKEGRGFFGTRARRQGNTLTIEWFNQNIVETAGGRRVFSKFPGKGRGYRFPD